jgi:hypothetical protein
MVEQHETTPESVVPVENGTIRRRGLIAGAAALAAGLLATRTAAPVSAGVDGDIVANTTTFTTATTGITTGAKLAASPAFSGNNFFPSAPDAKGDGVQGYTTAANNSGIFGRNNDLNGVGTWGEAPNGTGAFGDSGSGSGVAGSSSSGNGVYGQSASGTGVFGTTTSGLYGVAGISGTASGSAGLVGVATGPNAVAFGTIVQGGATFAGYFNGTTVVNGAFAVTGSKSAAVKDASGQYRLMYSVESPEAWFEDFGTGTLVNGKATVKLDPQFAQHIHTDQYHVFISEDGDHNGLHTTAKNTSGFTVEASSLLAKAAGVNAAQAQGSFSWRVVAKRNDIKGERLATFAMPPKLTLAAPTPSALPKPRR